MLQPLKFGVSAVTSDGRDVGTLYRVVIDERSNIVTAVTIQRRLIESGNLLKPGGWEKPRDLIAPFTAVTGADDGEVRLSLTEQEFLALPPYVIGEVPESTEGWSATYKADDVSMRASTLLGGVYSAPEQEQDNRGPNERHLSHGAPVWRREPHTHLGDLDRVLMDDETNAVTALVVRHGVLFARDTVLPLRYMVDLLDDLVHVAIPDAEWDALQEYQTNQ